MLASIRLLFLLAALVPHDVPRVADQLVEQHVDAEEITPKILERSYALYLHQFDPYKLFLLQEEVGELPRVSVRDFRRADLSPYEQLNGRIVEAIERERAWRREEGAPKAPLYTTYAKTLDELRERQLGAIASSGDPRLYFHNLDAHEEPYLTEERLPLRVLKALAASLDPHTTYFSEEEARALKSRLAGQFTGIGIVVSEGGIITRVIPDSPAAGKIEVGDRILGVDGATNLSFPQLIERLRGPLGSKVTLQLEQGGKVTLKREEIAFGRLEVDEEGEIAILRLPAFYNGATADMQVALEDLQAKEGLVLDLRGNRGGYLVEAIAVAGLFIRNGVIAMVRGADEVEIRLRDIDGRVHWDKPLVILISHTSASAAELVAGALQDYGAAIIVGDPTTYGKGTVQAQNEQFKVTVGRFYTPSGRSPQLTGIASDIAISNPKNPQGEAYLQYPLPPDTLAPQFDDDLSDLDLFARPWFLRYYLPNLEKRDTRWEEHLPLLQERSHQRHRAPSDDPQLTEAVAVLEDMIALQDER